MMELILSIDIGYVNPAFVLSYYENNTIQKILIFKNFKFKQYIDSFKYLKYFFSLKVTKVIIEKQYLYARNIALMTYIHGFFMSHDIPVFILDPIAKIRPNKAKKSSTRAIRKAFSVNIINNILERQHFSDLFKMKDSDICDALNLVFYHLYKGDDYINKFDISIENIYYVDLA